MALPYPEGAVYFRRSALHLRQSPHNFDAQHDRTFYSHCLLEHVWNYYTFAPWTNPNVSAKATHPRARVETGTPQQYRTEFGKSHFFPVRWFLRLVF